MKKKWSAGKIIAVVLGGAAAGLLLLVSFMLGIWSLSRGNLFFGIAGPVNYGQRRGEEYARVQERGKEQEKARGDEEQKQEEPNASEPEDSGDSSGSPDSDYEDEYDENSEYYEFHNAIRDDLSYEASFEYYGDLSEENITVQVNYPVISGSNSQEEYSGVNSLIQKELEEIKTYAANVSQWLPEGSSFLFEADSYITYMDEEILSVIYVEHGYLDDEVYETYVVSLNIDMESKMAFTNSQIININDDFSVDFRSRCERQNGEISSLSIYTDQEITEMLNDDNSLIIFYTPMGMEIGFNYYYGWVTVTYKDYEKYRSLF